MPLLLSPSGDRGIGLVWDHPHHHRAAFWSDCWNPPVWCITTPCAHFVELSLRSGESLAGTGCFGRKSNWTKFDHSGSTGGHWETISGSFSIPFGSGLKVQSQCAPIIPSPCSTIYEEDKFYSSLMIVIFSVFSNSHCLSWSDGLRVILNERWTLMIQRNLMIPCIQWTLIIQTLQR